MTVGDNEIELLREQLIYGITRAYLRHAFLSDVVFIKGAVMEATEGWCAYRVRTYVDGKLEERWQIRSQWAEVKGSDVDAGNRVERHPDVP
jgi:hypothetical protein